MRQPLSYVVWCVGGMILFAVAMKFASRWMDASFEEPRRSVILVSIALGGIALGFLIDWIRKPRGR